MGRLLTAVTASAVSASAAVEVPDDLRTELVELYKHLQQHPEQRGHATFDTPDELATFVKQAKSWATTNEVQFRVVRGSATDTSIAFYLRDIPTEAEREAAAKAREEAAAKRAAEGKAKPGRKPKAS